MKQAYRSITAVSGVCALALLAGACNSVPKVSNAEYRKVNGLVTACSGISIEKNQLKVHRQGQTIRAIGFGKDESAWDHSKAMNYYNYLDIQFGKELYGRTSLYVGGGKERKATDTAWQIETKPLPFDINAKQFSVNLDVCADFCINSISGDGYKSQIKWYDAEGKVIKNSPFNVMASQSNFQGVQTIGDIPDGTKSFSVSLGFDGPNVNVGNFCAFSNFEVTALNDNSPYVSAPWFELAPEQLENPAISWTANCPAGTEIKFQIADADDNNGVPGTWSAFHGPDGTSQSFFTAPFNATKKWSKLRVQYTTKGTKYPELTSLTMNGKTADNWMFYRGTVEPLIENITVSPTRNRREDIVLRVSCQTPVNWNTFSAKIDGEDATAQFSRNGEIFVGKAIKDYADGLHKIEVSIKNINGKVGQGVKYLFIGDSPANVPHVTLRDDGMTLVDGKPIFPIGAYAVWKREFNNNDFDKAFKDLADAGFNFAHSYNGGAEYKNFLDSAQKHGLYVWSRAYNINDKDFMELRLNHPAVIAWYIGDDTSMNTTINQLQDRHDALKALDDHRITTQADPVDSYKMITNYHDYVRGSDNILPEIYPVRQDTPEDRAKCVSEVIRDMKACAFDCDSCGTEHPRSIWPIIQYFQGWNGWKRFPEENEIRAMSFASIIHGATGITWYTYGGYHNPKTNKTNYGITSTPERWRIITTITRQIRELEPVLVERTPVNQPTAKIISGNAFDTMGFPSVTCLMKKHDGYTFILAVNSTLDTVKAEIPVNGINGGTVMFEERNATCGNGRLTDTFKPYDVHIYRLK